MINYHELRTTYRMARKPLSLGWLMIIIALLMIVLVQGCAYASDIQEKDAVLAIIGEAENQGYIGMLAVACAIRNRGTLDGVYGLHSARVMDVFKHNGYIRRLAIKAWSRSIGVDITHGATNWENIGAFGNPYWVREMVETFRYRDHVFYKKRG